MRSLATNLTELGLTVQEVFEIRIISNITVSFLWKGGGVAEVISCTERQKENIIFLELLAEI